MRVCIAHERGVELMGPLPPGVEVAVGDLAEPGVEFWVPPFLGTPPAAQTVRDLAALRVIQLLTAGVDGWLERVPDGVTLCAARGAHSSSTAEWALTAILACLRDFPSFVRAQSRAQWSYHPTDELAGKRVLLVGAGDIGEAVAARLDPFQVSVVRVTRRARPGTHGVDELPALLPHAQVVVLTVPLTQATTRMVDERFLAAMPDGALLVNAARGQVVDTEALTAELATGRLQAALDVIDPEPLPPDHPLWNMPNLLLTPHVAASVGGGLRRAYGVVGDQLRRYAAGEPLRYVVDGDY